MINKYKKNDIYLANNINTNITKIKIYNYDK